MKTKFYYDGIEISKYKSYPNIEGFTTNTSFVLQGKDIEYTEFIKNYLVEVKGKPCSFQVLSDDDKEIIKQTKIISSLGENVYVKIPIIKRDGSSNDKLISTLLNENIKINITVIHTIPQIDLAVNSLNHETPTIISVFAGGITDAGVDPVNIIKYAILKTYEYANAEILWAGCQTNLHINQAIDCGCHIITIPGSILDKMNRMKLNLEETSIVKVNKFLDDGAKIKNTF